MSDQKKNDSLRIEDEVKPRKSLAIVTTETWGALEKKDKKSLKQILEAGAEDYSDISLDEQEEEQLVKVLKKMATGAAVFAPMNCAGSNCPFATQCPLARMGKAPINKPCLLEENMFKESTIAYVSEYEVDPNNFTELGICTELAEIEILQWRLNMTLRTPEHATLVIEQAIGQDPHGEAITQLQVSPVFEQKQKLANRKSKLIKLMVGDRQEKYKKEAALKQKSEEDASSQMSAVRAQLAEMEQQMRLKKKEADEVIDVQFVSAEDLIAQSLEEDDNEEVELGDLKDGENF